MTRAPEKSDGAFRTIREVADWLTVPTHVLRFWESKFDQIAPVKGAGGRRYYRPEDMRLLGGIKVMLHDQGLTIRAVSQKIEDDGVDPVMALSPELEMPEQPIQRTRRVIRQGEDDGPAKVVPLRDAEPVAPVAPPAAPVEIAKEPPSSPAEVMPDQPDAPAPDTMESAPAPAIEDPLPEAPAPEPETLDEAPVDTPEAPLPDAPADAPETVTHAPDPEPEPEPETPAPPPEDTQPADPLAEPAQVVDAVVPPPMPTLRALRLARAARTVSDPDRMRLRRVIRRYRALCDEISDDLAEHRTDR